MIATRAVFFNIIPLLSTVIGCSQQEQKTPVEPHAGGPSNNIDFLANHYFHMYANRDDWEGFLSLYHDSMKFEDVILRFNYNGKEAFRDFYNWPDTGFVKHPDYSKTLVLEDLATTDSSAVGQGYFTPFYYQGKLYQDQKNMRFTIWLYFDNTGKITRQVDFIAYPPNHLKAIAERLMREE